MSDLFDTPKSTIPAPRPLADRLRPQTLAEVIGQSHVLSAQGPLGSMIGAHSLSSLILWGPPGVGKTTIARLLAQQTDLAFVQISAIFTGDASLKSRPMARVVAPLMAQTVIDRAIQIHGVLSSLSLAATLGVRSAAVGASATSAGTSGGT